MIRVTVPTLLAVLLATAVGGGHTHSTPAGSALGMLMLAQHTGQPGPEAPSFEEVAAILRDNCTRCHAPPSPAADLALQTYAEIMKGGRSGPAVVPGDPGKSELVRRMRGLSEPRMPLSGPPWLPEEQIALIERWIRAGAGSSESMGGATQSPTTRTGTPSQGGGNILYGNVSPIFQGRCVKCHAPKGQLGPPPEGIRLDTYETLIRGGERPIVIPGVPGASTLQRSVLGQSRPRMPMDGPPYLDPAETDLIGLWIQEGAPDDSGTKAPIPIGAKIRLGGTLTDYWAIDGLTFVVDGKTRIKKRPPVGSYVQIRGVVAQEAAILATEIRAR